MFEPKNYDWLSTEEIGNGVMSIAKCYNGTLVYVFLDKHGIANVFETLTDFMDYWEGNLDCKRICWDPYETGIEGTQQLKIK